MSNTPQYYFDFKERSPILQIAEGEEIRLELPDSDGLGPDLALLPTDVFDYKPGTAFPGNPLYGPITVVGAEMGDALAVEILSVKPNRPIARTLLDANHGFPPDNLLRAKEDEVIPTRLFHWRLDEEYAFLEKALGTLTPRVRLSPFIGCIGTASMEGAVPSLDAGAHGGNMDIPDLGVGCTILLPVNVPGGMLYVGDLHAAQGAGELVGGALEISGVARLRCKVVKGAHLHRPRYINETGRGAIATQPTAGEAVSVAFAAMVHWLVEEGIHRYDAYMFLSQVCQFRIGGLNRHSATVACFLPNAAYANPESRKESLP